MNKLRMLCRDVRAHTAKLRDAVSKFLNAPAQETEMPQTIDDLVAAVAAEDAVIDSAVALINGFQQRLTGAIAAALAGGATADQLKALVTLKDDVAAKSKALSDAVAANTPTPPPTLAPSPAP